MKHRSFHPRVFAALLALVMFAGSLLSWQPANATATALATALATASAAAQDTPLQMTLTVAFDGYFKYGEWIPLYVQIENRGPDMEAEIQAGVVTGTGTNIFAAPVSLPSGSRKLVTLYVLPNNFSHALDVELISGDQVVASAEGELKSIPNVNYLVGIVAPERGALSLVQNVEFSGIQRTKTMVDVPLAELPERVEGLRSFDLLIFNDSDTSSLTPAQNTALQSWVYQGGRLIIGGGPGARQTTSGLDASLLPLVPDQQVTLETVSGLESLGGNEAVRVPGPFVVASAALTSGHTLASQDGLPLVVEKTVGAGQVDYVALDLSGAPFDAWSGAADFWTRMLSSGAAYPDWLPPDMSVRQMRSSQMVYALSNLPSLDLPSIRGLAVLLSVYVLLVGPLNYLFLRWRKRLQLAWVTIPVITLLFAAGAFGLGYLLRGTDLIMNKIIIIESQAGGTAQVSSYYGLFSPAQQSYQIDVEKAGLLSPINQSYDPWSGGMPAAGGEVTYVQGETARLRGLSVNQWSMQTFMTEGTLTDLGAVSSALRMEGNRLVGTLTNETRLTLEDTVLVLGAQFTRLGTLAPGQQVDVSLDVPGLSGPDFGPPISYRLFEEELNNSGPTGPSREVTLKQSILDTIFQWGSFGPVINAKSSGVGSSSTSTAIVLAWFKETDSDVRISGRAPLQQSTGLLFMPVSYLFPENGPITLPPGIISGELVEMPIEGGMCGGSGTPAVYLGRGTALFEFNLPADLQDIQVDALTLALSTDGGWNQPPATSVYDWTIPDWVSLDNVIIGSNEIQDPANYVNSEGVIRIQLASDNRFAGGCYFLGLGLTGARP